VSNNKKYTVEELATDESFISWFLGEETDKVNYWDTWISANPDQQSTVDAAMSLLTELMPAETTVSDEHSFAARDRLMSAIHDQRKPATVLHMRPRTIWWASAAVIVGLILLSVFYLPGVNSVKYETEYAESRNIVLPDGSQVTLNARSSLRINKNWKAGETREVWLDGEGFFSVVHTRENSKFIVHARDINVEVLGTEFNLQRRRERTKVILHSGKVQLTEVDGKQAAPIIMKPGDIVEYNDRSHSLVRKTGDIQMYSALKDGKMIFNNADFTEIQQVLEDNYGLKVTMDNIDLKGKQFNGVFPVNNLQILLTALGKAYDIAIDVNDKEIKIRNANNPSSE
jgi:ferric-dicitrate binding protein FerR (iron transport regulator)